MYVKQLSDEHIEIKMKYASLIDKSIFKEHANFLTNVDRVYMEMYNNIDSFINYVLPLHMKPNYIKYYERILNKTWKQLYMCNNEIKIFDTTPTLKEITEVHGTTKWWLAELKGGVNKYDKPMMETAVIWANMSSCTRRKVGCVIAKDGRIVSNGYNGTISGMNNNCEDEVLCCTACKTSDLPHGVYKDGVQHCIGSNVMTMLVTNEFTLHAEQNAITHAAKLGISLDSTTIYITTSPCKTCAKLIAQSGIKRVVYLDKYKDISGIEFLDKIGIETYHYQQGE